MAGKLAPQTKHLFKLALMSCKSPPKLADFELLVARSDGFIDAEWRLSGQRVLLRKLRPDEGWSSAMRLQLQRDIARAQTLREPGALELLASFEEEGTSYFVLTHFYGRALSVQLARGRSFTPAEAL